jgi:hypothetical protein
MKYTSSISLSSCLERVPMIFLTKNIILQITLLGKTCVPTSWESFGFGYNVINYCFISCKNALQKMLFLIGITCQMHARESHRTSSVIVSEALWTPACTCFFVMQLDTGLCKPSKTSSSWKMSVCPSV